VNSILNTNIKMTDVVNVLRILLLAVNTVTKGFLVV